LALFLAMAGTVLAEPAGITLLGSGFTGTPFAITGDIVAESDSLYETIRDFSQPDAPTVISSTMGHAMDTILREFVCGDGLLVGLTGPAPYGEIGLSLFDVNDLAKPDYLGTINTLPYESAWMRGRELLASTNGLLVAYDLSAPLSPLFTAFIPLATHDGSRWPSAVGNTLYQIETGATLRALDVSSAGQPATLGLPALAGDRIDALAAGTGVIYALVAVSVGQVDEHLDLVTSNVGRARSSGGSGPRDDQRRCGRRRPLADPLRRPARRRHRRWTGAGLRPGNAVRTRSRLGAGP
jgi:hypothetical protein